jgi:hypothetical protein
VQEPREARSPQLLNTHRHTRLCVLCREVLCESFPERVEFFAILAVWSTGKSCLHTASASFGYSRHFFFSDFLCFRIGTWTCHTFSFALTSSKTILSSILFRRLTSFDLAQFCARLFRAYFPVRMVAIVHLVPSFFCSF